MSTGKVSVGFGLPEPECSELGEGEDLGSSTTALDLG